jgi:tRNA(Arg) A34 adenosine deaminase TadA
VTYQEDDGIQIRKVPDMNEMDLKLLRASLKIARRARDGGNHPFGAVLADDRGRILLEAENTVVTAKDCTAHAETNLIRKACAQYDGAFLAKCTLYASTEPCAMCAAAIFWANIRRVVYGLSARSLYELRGGDSEEVLHLPCREVFAKGRKPIEVIGPLLEDEYRQVHLGFWR